MEKPRAGPDLRASRAVVQLFVIGTEMKQPAPRKGNAPKNPPRAKPARPDAKADLVERIALASELIAAAAAVALELLGET